MIERHDLNRKMHKKIISVIVIFFSVSVILSSCSGKTNENQVENSGQNAIVGAKDENDSIVVEKPNKIVIEEDSREDMQIEEIEYIELDDSFEEGELYTDPILMNQTDNHITVVWFTKEDSNDNCVYLYDLGNEKKPTRKVYADSYKLSRIRGGKEESNCDDQTIKRDIYRHEALVEFDPGEEVIPYRVASDGIASGIFTLNKAKKPGEGVKILLTSDHQLKYMCAANIQKVMETVGQVDAVLANGDLVDVTDRAYDWFDADNSFFKIMQGRASYKINGRQYNGAAILQNAPIYASIGNHDVMGVYSDSKPLNYQFNNPSTREHAYKLLDNSDLSIDLNNEEEKELFIKNNSFNTDSWEEIFTLPQSSDGDERYYAFSIGDIRVIVLEVARIWRLANVGLAGKYSEIPGASENDYGFGQFIFEDIGKGSKQYDFLKKELESKEYINSKYHVVMYHFDSHSLGGNTIPAYTDPVPMEAVSPVTGQKMVLYDYPIDKDYLINDIEPLLEEHDVDLVFTAHSHIWNRFITKAGTNILQTSNVGNTYNCFYDEGDSRELVPSAFSSGDSFHSLANKWDKNNYILNGDPGGLEAIMPNIKSLPDDKPYLASNSITAFSILDTNKGTVDSYYFDTENPDSEVVLFDSFAISQEEEQKEKEKTDMSGELIKDTENLMNDVINPEDFSVNMNEVTEVLCPGNVSEIRKGIEYPKPVHFEYYSNTTGCKRGANVLLPVNYDKNKEYPVLYFLHGIFGDEGSMLQDANNRIPQIVKNLTDDGIIEDVIVVFPNMFATGDPNIKPGFTDAQTAPYDNFINDLVDDLIPYVEANYHVSSDREKRGLIGFSMGGRESIFIGLQRSDLFAYIGAIAPAPGLVEAKDWAMEHKGQMKKDEFVVKHKDSLPELFLVCCGTKDSVVGQYPASYNKIMNENKVEHLWYEVPGADHDSNAIRSGFYNLLIRWLH